MEKKVEKVITNVKEIDRILEKANVKNSYRPIIIDHVINNKDFDLVDVASSKKVKIKEGENSIEIELDGSVLENDNMKKLLQKIHKKYEVPKNALVGTLTLLENKEEATQEEIAEFAGYGNITHISNACSTLESLNVIRKEDTDNGMRIILLENWIENIVKESTLQERRESIIKDMGGK